MRTQRCPVLRLQKPPYQWKTTDYHQWRRIDGKVVGCCRHCGQFPDQVLVPDESFAPSHPEALEDSRA